MCACKSDEAEQQERLEQMGRHVGFRKNEIVFNLRATCPTLKSYDAHQLASFIDDNERFDDDGLRVESEPDKIALYGSGQDGEHWSIEFARKSMSTSEFASLVRVLREEIKEQKENHFQIRRITQKAVNSFFDGFPQHNGRGLTTKAFKERWFRSKQREKAAFAKSIKDDFWHRFKKFYNHLRVQHVDVQDLVENGWLPLRLQEAFYVHFVCQVGTEEEMPEWKTKLYDGLGQIATQATMWTAGWMKQEFQRRSRYHMKYGEL